MSDTIHVLSDAVANQIAAGEVIQRPASVVKELLENAVDAGATVIAVQVKDAGKTLIQVTDDGSGMSRNDALLCFERHATSKIREAADLFAISTKGFRGEALASIAAVAEISMKTRRENDELGTQVRITGSKLESCEPVQCRPGTSLQVRNLFFNIPARRNYGILLPNSTMLPSPTKKFILRWSTTVPKSFSFLPVICASGSWAYSARRSMLT
jgi:DNA mismatch repair protein MutL